jgi:hypothetical protein
MKALAIRDAEDMIFALQDEILRSDQLKELESVLRG